MREVEDILEGPVQGLYTGDLLVLAEMMGKLPADAGVPEACVRYTGSTFYEITVDGLLFGERAYGTIWSEITVDDALRTMRETTLYSDDLDYQQAYDALAERFGEPVSSGDEPYVEVNGGAVHRDLFDGGTFNIQIQCAGNISWILILFTEKSKAA